MSSDTTATDEESRPIGAREPSAYAQPIPPASSSAGTSSRNDANHNYVADTNDENVYNNDGDAELAPPPDETNRDETALFRAERPLVPSPKRIYSWLEYTTSLSLLGILSFWGTLIRLGLSALGTYEGQSVFPLIWAQIMGCFLMGMFTVRKRCIEEM